jgi:site-specific DNA-methyltransferase (adenine-specific)
VPRIILADNLEALAEIPSGSIDLIYIDPPFNTGRPQVRTRLKTVRDPNGDRVGFQGRRYRTERGATQSFSDRFDDFVAFLDPRLREAYRVLARTGSFFLHIDPREAHYCKVALDGVFGRRSFMNEIIWAYDFGGRSSARWPAKHDQILWYAKDPRSYTFNRDAIDRIPYLAPGLVTPEKAARGKVPTDVWWQTIVPTHSKERTGYPTQKPLAILLRIVRVHSNPGDVVLDFFAGSGTSGEAAAREGRDFILIDHSLAAVRLMARRLAFAEPSCEGFRIAHPRESNPRKTAANRRDA